MAKTEAKPNAKILTHILLGILLGLIITVLLLLLCSILISSGGVRLEFARQLAIAACAIGIFTAGILSVRRCGKYSLPVGLAVGMGHFLILCLLAPLLAKDVTFGSNQLPLLFACICAGALAGLAGKKRKKRRI